MNEGLVRFCRGAGAAAGRVEPDVCWREVLKPNRSPDDEVKSHSENNGELAPPRPLVLRNQRSRASDGARLGLHPVVHLKRLVE
eukprot:scaffold61113_cov32-Tisochrysis_lutea.AAC.2